MVPHFLGYKMINRQETRFKIQNRFPVTRSRMAPRLYKLGKGVSRENAVGIEIWDPGGSKYQFLGFIP
jgi:hypothetical protein